MCPTDPSAYTTHEVPEADASDDSGISDLESVYSTEDGSYTQTLASYVTRYTYLEGRRFDAGQKYSVSNDEIQQDQMDLFHDIYFRALGNKLFLAPISEKPQRVLDLGTGTGIWAVDFADAHPSAAVIGNDLSPIQPDWVPVNCTFEVDDFNKDWTYTKSSFDFIHARAIHGSVTDWSKLLAQAYKALKPGGWIEVVSEDAVIHCDDGSMPPDTPLQKWLKETHRVLADIFKCDPKPILTIEKKLDDAGFDMKTFKKESFPVPIGTWPKKKEDKTLGGMMLINMLQGIDGWSVMIWSKLLGKSTDEYQALLKSWKDDAKNKKHHKYMCVDVVYVQKPMDEES